MVFAGNAWPTKVVDLGIKLNRVDFLFVFEPVFIVVAESLVGRRVVAPVENPVAVIGADLVVLGRCQVQFAHQGAVVASFGQSLGHQFFVRRKVGVAIAVDMVGSRVSTRQEARPGGRADRALGIGPIEGHTRGRQGIERVGANMGIAQRVDGVPALLVCAVPQNIGARGRHGAPTLA